VNSARMFLRAIRGPILLITLARSSPSIILVRIRLRDLAGPVDRGWRHVSVRAHDARRGRPRSAAGRRRMNEVPWSDRC